MAGCDGEREVDGGGGGLTVRDVCDLAYQCLLEKWERNATTAALIWAVKDASGRYDMRGEQPDASMTQELLDEALEAEFESEHLTPEDLEMLQLMGVR